MKRVRVVLLALAVAAFSHAAAYADGAIAVGKGANVLKSGIAVGLSTDFPSAKTAAADAMAQCKGSKVKGSTRALCKIVKTFKNQCAAVAFDVRVGAPGFGWGVGGTKGQASSAAVASCNANSGKAGPGACKAVGVDCD
jgi:hypothetical protein